MTLRETIHIACTSDDLYVPHTAAMLHSLWWHNRTQAIVVHFLCGAEPSSHLRRKLERMTRSLGLELHWVEVPASVTRDLPGHEYISNVVWYRIFLPELLPDLDRILYLDSDVIVTDDIGALWRTDLGNHYFAAVTNVVPAQYSRRVQELGLRGAGDYFNAGVVLWNLAVMRREGMTRTVLDWAREHMSRLLWLEQDALNVLYSDRRLPLHPRWNCQNGLFYSVWGRRLLDSREVAEALERPALVHFEGGEHNKPWHVLSTHPFRSRYFFHRHRTPWPLVRRTGVTPRNVVKRLLPESLKRRLREWRG